MTRKVKVEAGQDVGVDQSVDKEAGTVEKTGLVRSIFDDKGKLAIVAMASVMISELALYGVLALVLPEVPQFPETLLIATLAALGGVCGSQKLNGLKSK